MDKRPSFAFYSQDFIVGTMFMSDAQVGAYIRLLCWQHQKGRLAETLVKKITDDAEVLEKFVVDEDGLYYNKKLEKVMEDRKNFTERQSENGSKGGRPKNPNETQMKPKQNPNESLRVENEIGKEIENNLSFDVDVDVDFEGGAGGNMVGTGYDYRLGVPDPDFASFWEAYPKKEGIEMARRVWYFEMSDMFGINPGLKQDIIQAVKYAKDKNPSWKDYAYIPHASKWLSECRWKDVFPDDTGQQARPLQSTTSWRDEKRAREYSVENKSANNLIVREVAL